MSHLLRYFCLVFAAVAAHAFQAPAPQPAKGSIEGQVVNARVGTPLKRAMVRLMSVGQPGVPNQRPINMNKETDEQGRYSFTNLEPGKYRLTAERQGYLRLSYGSRKYSGGSTPVAVAEGQTVKSIDFRLTPQGVITGRVLDEDGEPIANVQVRAQRSYISNGRKVWNTVANANTSDIGEYRLPELKPGRYVVSALPRMNGMNMAATASTEPLPNTPEMSYAATFYPSTADSSAAIPVEVGEGSEVRGTDVRLVKARVFRVRGVVTGLPSGDGGRRPAIIPVTLTPREGNPTGMQLSMGQARFPEGNFEIRNVPPGQYIAHTQTQIGGVQYIAATNVDVIGNHMDGVQLRLATGGDIQGSVKLVDAAAPLELKNLQVSLRPVGFGAQAPRARVDDDLKFVLKGVPPIRFAVNVSGYPETCYVKSIQYGGADIPAEGVEMTNGGVIEVVLSAGAGQIDVVISAGENKSAAGAQVLLLKDAVPTTSRSADENGMLSIKGLKPGSYRVIAWEDIDPEQLRDTDYLRKFENEGKSIKLDTGGHEAVQLKAIAVQ